MPSKSSKLYFDYAASTPVAPEVFRAMKPYFSDKFGNPGSLHSFGQEAMAAVDASRETVANALGAKFREIIFTGSATEANNLALRGAIAAGVSRLIVSSTEHESVLETARVLKNNRTEVVILPVDKKGLVQLGVLESALAGAPALVSIMYANNETGAIQPIARISKLVHEAGGIMHTDAAQTFQFLDCDVSALGVDMLTLSGHKIYGPKGVGALYAREGMKIIPVVSGGGQEFGLRSGTENIPLIAGFASAVSYIGRDKKKNAARILKLKEELIRGIKKIHPRAELNEGQDNLPNIVNVWIPGKKSEDLLICLDLAGIAISAGSACTARSSQPSHVLRAMGLSDSRTGESIRLSLGRPSTIVEIKRLLQALNSR